jgi:hypothetical protein
MSGTPQCGVELLSEAGAEVLRRSRRARRAPYRHPGEWQLVVAHGRTREAKKRRRRLRDQKRWAKRRHQLQPAPDKRGEVRRQEVPEPVGNIGDNDRGGGGGQGRPGSYGHGLAGEKHKQRKQRWVAKRWMHRRRDRLVVGTWNVRTLMVGGKKGERPAVQVVEELREVGVDICGLQEVRRAGEGQFVEGEYAIHYFGNERGGDRGVGFAIRQELIAGCGMAAECRGNFGSTYDGAGDWAEQTGGGTLCDLLRPCGEGCGYRRGHIIL